MIITSIPSNLQIPGAYSQIEYKSASEGFVPVENRCVIVAEKTAAGTATADTPYDISNDVDADTRFGVGSPAATLARFAREQGLFGAGMPKLSIVGVAEPVGAKTVKTLTATLTSPKAGNFRLEIGRHDVVVGVSTSDTSASFAANLKSEIDKLALICPITASVAAAVVTVTATVNGENGNDLVYRIAEAPSGTSVVIATPTPGSGAASIANALASLYDQNYDAGAIANHKSADIDALKVDLATAWAPGTENFRHYFVGETGSIGTAQALQAQGNTEKICVLSMENGRFLPGEVAVGVMIETYLRSAPNASLNGAVIKLKPCLPAYAYTGGPSGEQQLLLSSGVTPLIPAEGFIKIVRLITTIRTVDGIPFTGTRDLAYSRTAAWLARQVAYRFVRDFKQRSFDAQFLVEVRDMVVAVHRAAERAGYLRDVELLLAQIIVEESPDEPGRAMLSAPFRVAGPAHQLFAKHIMLI